MTMKMNRVLLVASLCLLIPYSAFGDELFDCGASQQILKSAFKKPIRRKHLYLTFKDNREALKVNDRLLPVNADTVHVEKIDEIVAYFNSPKYYGANAVIDKSGAKCFFHIYADSDSLVLDNLHVFDNVTIEGRKRFNKLILKNGSVLYDGVQIQADSVFIQSGSVVKNITSLEPKYIYAETDDADWRWQRCRTLEELIICSSKMKKLNLYDGLSDSTPRLKKIVIPDSVEELGSRCFRGTLLEEIVLPSNLKELPDECFYNCRNLKSIVIPPSVESVGQGCFSWCYSLKEVVISDGGRELSGACFLGCSSLEEIIIPPSVERIGKRCFAECTSLKKIELPSHLEILSEECFSNCTSLKELVIPKSTTKIWDDSTPKDLALTLLSDSPPQIVKGQYTLLQTNTIFVPAESYNTYKNDSSWGEYSIVPKGPYKAHKVTTQKAGSLLSVLPPNDLPRTDSLTVSGPINDVDISIINKMPALSYLDLSNAKPTLSEQELERIRSAINSQNALMSLIGAANAIPKNTGWIMTMDEYQKRISATAFADAATVKSPDDVISTLKKAGPVLLKESFSNMRMLQEVRLPKFLKTIPENCFSGCSKLARVILPENLTIINQGAFSGTALEFIQFPSTTQIILCGFYGHSIKDVDLSLTSCYDGLIGNWRGEIEKFILPSKLKRLNLNCTPHCPTITIPASVTEMMGTKENCSIVFNSMTPPIGNYSLKNCTISCPVEALTDYYAKFSEHNKVIAKE